MKVESILGAGLDGGIPAYFITILPSCQQVPWLIKVKISREMVSLKRQHLSFLQSGPFTPGSLGFIKWALGRSSKISSHQGGLFSTLYPTPFKVFKVQGMNYLILNKDFKIWPVDSGLIIIKLFVEILICQLCPKVTSDFKCLHIQMDVMRHLKFEFF